MISINDDKKLNQKGNVIPLYKKIASDLDKLEENSADKTSKILKIVNSNL